MTANDDRLSPTRNQSRNVGNHDGFAEDHTAEDVADGAVGRLPHLLETKFLYALFIWSDGRALNGHAVKLGGFGRVNGDLVVGCIAVFNAQVKVLQINVEVRKDQLLLNKRPDDARHLVAIHLNDRVLYFDLAHVHVSLRVCDGEN